MPLALVNLGTAAFWQLTAAGPARSGPSRWAVALALVVGPFVGLGRRLSAGLGPRTYRYATMNAVLVLIAAPDPRPPRRSR